MADMTPEQIEAEKDLYEAAMAKAGYTVGQRGKYGGYLYAEDQRGFVSWEVARAMNRATPAPCSFAGKEGA